MLSAAYQRSAEPRPGNEKDDRFSSRYLTRRLPAEVILDAFSQVTGVPTAKLVAQLWERWRIIATPIVHAEYEGARITPNVYTTVEEIDTFATAVETIAT